MEIIPVVMEYAAVEGSLWIHPSIIQSSGNERK